MYTTLRHSALLTLSFTLFLGAGCVDNQPEPGGKFGWQYGDSDMFGADLDSDQGSSDMGGDSDIDSGGEDTTPDILVGPVLPRVEVVRYRRQFEDCTRSTCLTELQFGMRSGIVSRIQSNNSITGRQTLKEEDYSQLKTLAQSTSFIEYVAGMNCPEPPLDTKYSVMLTVDVYDNGEDFRYVNDITGCYDNDTYETIDDLITYSESIFMNYYK